MDVYGRILSTFTDVKLLVVVVVVVVVVTVIVVVVVVVVVVTTVSSTCYQHSLTSNFLLTCRWTTKVASSSPTASIIYASVNARSRRRSRRPVAATIAWCIH